MSVCYYSSMFQAVSIVMCLFAASVCVTAQTAAQKIIDSEHAFAKRALEIGAGPSFLEFMTDDAWAFTPDAVRAKSAYSAQKRDESILEWAPNFADAASDGSFGYTTGNWQYRAKQGAEPSAFGEFNTIWVKQRDGGYKWVIDIGIGHDKPVAYSTTVSAAPLTGGRHPSPPSFDMQIFDEQAGKDAQKAYATFASHTIRMIRRGKLPIIGSEAVQKEISGKMIFGTAIATQRASDMTYVLRPYTYGEEKGNELQVWKYDHQLAGWQIVLDVLKPVPPK